MHFVDEDKVSQTMDSPNTNYTPSEREATIIRLVADPYKHGHRDRVQVDIEGINNRSLIDNYFLTLDELQRKAAEQDGNEPQAQAQVQLKEHEKRLNFFRAYYLLANGYYTEQELKEHPGVVEVVKSLRAKGKLAEGEDIEYAGSIGGGRRRGLSSGSAVSSQKKKRGLRGRLHSILSRDG
ncbi:hypothetical protein G7Y79_00020g048190 [Physcia stellaris]|nr:hypothetical protein G7Y79_00020g048190 [Physcia stellaris]